MTFLKQIDRGTEKPFQKHQIRGSYLLFANELWPFLLVTP